LTQNPTVAEAMITQMQKISGALDTITKMGLPESLIILYVQKKTHLSQKDIKAVFDALRDFNKQIKLPQEAAAR
jgi:hypothetical protein